MNKSEPSLSLPWSDEVRIVQHGTKVVLFNICNGIWVKSELSRFKQIDRQLMNFLFENGFLDLPQLYKIIPQSRIKVMNLHLDLGNNHIEGNIVIPLVNAICKALNLSTVHITLTGWERGDAIYLRKLFSNINERYGAIILVNRFICSLDTLIKVLPNVSGIRLSLSFLLENYTLDEVKYYIQRLSTISDVPIVLFDSLLRIDWHKLRLALGLAQSCGGDLSISQACPFSGQVLKEVIGSGFSYEHVSKLEKRMLKKCIHMEERYPWNNLIWIDYGPCGIRCSAGSHSLSVDMHGNIYTCSLMRDVGEKGLSLKDFIKSPELLSNTWSVEADPTCQVCNVRYLCRGGCKALRVYLQSYDWKLMCCWLKEHYYRLLWSFTKNCKLSNESINV